MRIWMLATALMCGALVGCAGSGMTRAEYSQAAARVELGMSKAEFTKLFLKAQPRGAKAYPSGAVEVMELVVSEYRFAPSGDPSFERNRATGTESRLTWFYFYEGKLIQYGAPEDWPPQPDQLIEVRAR
jgi:hypothetical protein